MKSFNKLGLPLMAISALVATLSVPTFTQTATAAGLGSMCLGTDTCSIPVKFSNLKVAVYKSAHEPSLTKLNFKLVADGFGASGSYAFKSSSSFAVKVTTGRYKLSWTGVCSGSMVVTAGDHPAQVVKVICKK